MIAEKENMKKEFTVVLCEVLEYLARHNQQGYNTCSERREYLITQLREGWNEKAQEINELKDKLSRRNMQIKDLKRVLHIAKARILELHGQHGRDYSYKTLNSIEKNL